REHVAIAFIVVHDEDLRCRRRGVGITTTLGTVVALGGWHTAVLKDRAKPLDRRADAIEIRQQRITAGARGPLGDRLGLWVHALEQGSQRRTDRREIDRGGPTLGRRQRLVQRREQGSRVGEDRLQVRREVCLGGVFEQHLRVSDDVIQR